MTEHDLLTITEAGDLLRAPVATLRNWRHLGNGPTSFRLGRHVLCRRADVYDWINDQSGPRAGAQTAVAVSGTHRVHERP